MRIVYAKMWVIPNLLHVNFFTWYFELQGLIYTITDVKDLHEWMVDHLERHQLFERVLGDELVGEDVISATPDIPDSRHLTWTHLIYTGLGPSRR